MEDKCVFFCAIYILSMDVEQIIRSPKGYRTVLLAVKEPELKKVKSLKESAAKELQPDINLDDLMRAIEDLNKEVVEVVDAAQKINIECSKCCNNLNFTQCLKKLFRAKIKKASVV